jgi:nucleoid DNA-binding protein
MNRTELVVEAYTKLKEKYPTVNIDFLRDVADALFEAMAHSLISNEDIHIIGFARIKIALKKVVGATKETFYPQVHIVMSAKWKERFKKQLKKGRVLVQDDLEEEDRELNFVGN